MKSIKCVFGVQEVPNCISAALLIVRLVVGLAFIYHGWGKIQNPMAWMGADSPVPGVLQFLAALSEFGGGMALILGLLTRLSSLGIAITMLVASYFHMMIRRDPFVHPAGGPSYELATVYLTIALLFIAAGPGRFSLDRYVFGAKK